MYVAPQTSIRILKNVPLDNTYNNTIYFSSAENQQTYFSGLTKYTVNDATYQRVNKGIMRVEYSADNLYDCNYLMFRNNGFGTKWFYAFITSVEYVNNITSEIQFELDVMQTWMFDYELKECLVEREHSASDNIGDNTIPENLELGEYVTDDFDGTGVLGGLSIVIAATFDDEMTKAIGSRYGGLFSGIQYTVFENNAEGAGEAEQFIETATDEGLADGIVSIFMIDSSMVSEKFSSSPKSYQIVKGKNIYALGEYTPRNKKLFTYPYNFLYVTNLQGGSAAFPYEYFDGLTCTFQLTGDMSCDPSVVLAPRKYKGSGNLPNYDEKLVLTGYPQCPFAIDSYRAWLAQSKASLTVSAMSMAIGMAVPASQGLLPFVSYLGSQIPSATSMLVENYQHSIAPPQARGGTGSSTAASIGILDFAFMHKHIREEYARIIDEYFDMYGYACHRVKVPNRIVRPAWTYTKTSGCVIKGNLPADDIARICSIYDAGIRFWTNGNNVGNYSINNSV